MEIFADLNPAQRQDLENRTRADAEAFTYYKSSSVSS